jgi:hypothetical protein
MQCNAMQCNAMQCNAMQCNTLLTTPRQGAFQRQYFNQGILIRSMDTHSRHFTRVFCCFDRVRKANQAKEVLKAPWGTR